MARLADHPYIVRVITAGVTEGRPFLVMRYCPPPDLGVRVRTAPMSVVDAISTGIKIASAIETAHRVRHLHRDIKPSNVLVTTYNEPALTDFGIAGHMHEVDSDHEVRISYPWSPPELLDGRSNGSVASDVYSLAPRSGTCWSGARRSRCPTATTPPPACPPGSCTPAAPDPAEPTYRPRWIGCSSSRSPRNRGTGRSRRWSWPGR